MLPGLPDTLILCLHGVGPMPEGLQPDDAEYWIDREQFVDLLNWADEAERRTGVAISLSFDDGNRSDVDIVLPLLKEAGRTADFFICSDWIGQPGRLDGRDIAMLSEAGMTIGCHGPQHVDWRQVPPSKLASQILAGRRVIEEITNVASTRVAPPYGLMDAGVWQTLFGCGFQSIDTCDGGCTWSGGKLRFREVVRADQHRPSCVDRLLTVSGRLRNAVRHLARRSEFRIGRPMSRWWTGQSTKPA